ncbi:MAG: hypothetical protein ACXVEJ_13865, partial [Nocardioides sp.]
RDVNTPSAVLPAGTSLRRTITNVGDRALYFSSETSGFAGRVLVTPAAVRLAPGASATYTLRSLAGTGRLDDGWVTWKGADGTRARIPVVVTR